METAERDRRYGFSVEESDIVLKRYRKVYMAKEKYACGEILQKRQCVRYFDETCLVQSDFKSSV